MTLAIWYLSAFYRMQVLLVPSKRLEKRWGVKGQETSDEDTLANYMYAFKVAMEVPRICNKTPWESKCLVQALTARYLLHRKGIKTTMYLGVGKDEGKMVAHSWLRCGDKPITGGDGQGYAIVAKFAL